MYCTFYSAITSTLISNASIIYSFIPSAIKCTIQFMAFFSMIRFKLKRFEDAYKLQDSNHEF